MIGVGPVDSPPPLHNLDAFTARFDAPLMQLVAYSIEAPDWEVLGHVGRRCVGCGVDFLRRLRGVSRSVRAAVGVLDVLFDYVIAVGAALGLLIYLAYALVRPERF